MREVLAYETIMCQCGHERTVEIHNVLRKRTRYPDRCVECAGARIKAQAKENLARRKRGEPPKKESRQIEPHKVRISAPMVHASVIQQAQMSKLENLCNLVAQGKLAIAGVR